MKKIAMIAMILSAAAATAPAQRRPMPQQMPQEEEPAIPLDRSQAILTTLAGLAERKQIPPNFTDADGRMLRVLAEAINARKAVEVGTYEGALGLWLCMALDKTGGRLQAVQLNSQQSGAARAHYRHAGVEDLVNLIDGDVNQSLAKLKGPVDIAVVSAERTASADHVRRLLPLLRPGGLILIHYTDQPIEARPAVMENPAFETVLYRPGGGVALALKKR